MKKCFRVLFFVYFIFLSSGFGFLEEGEKARAVGDEFYSRLKAEDYPSALQLCDPQFFEATSEEDILKFLRILEDRLGKILSYSEAEQVRLETSPGEESNAPKGAAMITLTGREYSSGYELNPQSRTTGGTNVVLRYSIKRTLFDSQDTVSLSRREGDGAFRILAFHVDSAGLKPFVTEQMLLTNVS